MRYDFSAGEVCFESRHFEKSSSKCVEFNNRATERKTTTKKQAEIRLNRQNFIFLRLVSVGIFHPKCYFVMTFTAANTDRGKCICSIMYFNSTRTLVGRIIIQRIIQTDYKNKMKNNLRKLFCF